MGTAEGRGVGDMVVGVGVGLTVGGEVVTSAQHLKEYRSVAAKHLDPLPTTLDP